MATQGETTAVKVALISMVSAILVALIANADKFRAPVAVTPPPISSGSSEAAVRPQGYETVRRADAERAWPGERPAIGCVAEGEWRRTAAPLRYSSR